MPYLFKRSGKSNIEPESFTIEYDGFEPVELPKMGSLSISERFLFENWAKEVEKEKGQDLTALLQSNFHFFYSSANIALMAIRDYTSGSIKTTKELNKQLHIAKAVIVGEKTPDWDIPEGLALKIWTDFWSKEVNNSWNEPINEPASEGNEKVAA